MRRIAIIIIGALASLNVVTGAYAAGSAVSNNTDNDFVLGQDKYAEYFKLETADGDKNYLYTVTEWSNRIDQNCTIVTGKSESTIGISCSYPEHK